MTTCSFESCADKFRQRGCSCTGLRSHACCSASSLEFESTAEAEGIQECPRLGLNRVDRQTMARGDLAVCQSGEDLPEADPEGGRQTGSVC